MPSPYVHASYMPSPLQTYGIIIIICSMPAAAKHAFLPPPHAQDCIPSLPAAASAWEREKSRGLPKSPSHSLQNMHLAAAKHISISLSWEEVNMHTSSRRCTLFLMHAYLPLLHLSASSSSLYKHDVTVNSSMHIYKGGYDINQGGGREETDRTGVGLGSSLCLHLLTTTCPPPPHLPTSNIVLFGEIQTFGMHACRCES